MGKSIRSKIKKQWRAVKRVEVYRPLEDKMNSEILDRFLIDNYGGKKDPKGNGIKKYCYTYVVYKP